MNMEYTEYLVEHLDNVISYNEYIAENIDTIMNNSTDYSEYTADSLNSLNVISYADYIAEEIDKVIFNEVSDFVSGKYDPYNQYSYTFTVEEFFYDENIHEYYDPTS